MQLMMEPWALNTRLDRTEASKSAGEDLEHL